MQKAKSFMFGKTHLMKHWVASILGVVAYTASQGAAAGELVGTITKVEFFLENWGSLDYTQDGIAAIYVSGLPAACGTGYERLAISTKNPIYPSIVAAAIAAQARGAQVRVNYLDTCTVRFNAWDLAILQTIE